MKLTVQVLCNCGAYLSRTIDDAFIKKDKEAFSLMCGRCHTCYGSATQMMVVPLAAK